jgi:hypothetical protein
MLNNNKLTPWEHILHECNGRWRQLGQLKWLVVAWCMSFSYSALAQETLSAVLTRLKVMQTNEFSYIETREIQLLAEPWQGEGRMFLSPERMLIEQLRPKQSIVLLEGESMLYVEPENKVRFAKKLEGAYALPGLGGFLQLLYGNYTPQTLAAEFDTVFSQQENRWQIVLSPKIEDVVEQMTMSGKVDDGADELVIKFIDGDATNWKMELQSSGAQAKTLLDEIVQLTKSVKAQSGSEVR